MKLYIYILFTLLFLYACKEKPKNTSPIVLGDANTIVTETDSQFLKNTTEDISPTNKRSAEKQITTMMMQVDSAKSAQKLDHATNAAPLSGFTINFSDCDVIFDGLSAHAIQNTQDERTSNSVAYVRDGGNLQEMNLQINGLDEVKVEQRNFTRLAIEQGSENIVLMDLGKFVSPWYNLAGKDMKYISLGHNSLEFFPVDQTKIKNAFDRELRKMKKTRQEIQDGMRLIQKTNTASDPPCKVFVVSSQWRIIGKKNGKRVQKLIQFDIP